MTTFIIYNLINHYINIFWRVFFTRGTRTHTKRTKDIQSFARGTEYIEAQLNTHCADNGKKNMSLTLRRYSLPTMREKERENKKSSDLLHHNEWLFRWWNRGLGPLCFGGSWGQQRRIPPSRKQAHLSCPNLKKPACKRKRSVAGDDETRSDSDRRKSDGRIRDQT